MTYKVGDFAGYSPVTGQPTYVILGEETTMTDEPDAIAETENGRITADGRIYGRASRCDEFEEVAFPSVEMAHELAALLADAVKRVREDVSEELEVLERLINNHAVQLSGAESNTLELAERIEAVESTLGTEFNLSNRLDALADRLAAVEERLADKGLSDEWQASRLARVDSRSYAAVQRMDELEKRINNEGKNRQSDIYQTHKTLAQDLDSREETFHDELRRTSERVAALESDGESYNDCLTRLFTRVSSLEARQQDEAGEGEEPDLDDPFDLQPLSRETRHCLTDGALESLKEEVRRVTAREIVGRLWRFKTDGLDVAKMIERHYLPELPDDEAGQVGDQIDRDSMMPNAKETIRRDTAREIVERLRAMRDQPRHELRYDPTLADEGERAVADWIEREFGGE